ncbi:chymotrypsin-2-like isoform X2 [Pieris rapae]|uniref:chymotrypsin-2-like isoform X2 n=1 Tax=Pieris rapae TaxID=64459 RepID=UPI001E2810BE|nr:chymotrypsin-2-like isoform X2 [Pieris rapae]
MGETSRESDAFGGETRIVGDQYASQNFAMYQLSIRRHHNNKERHSCGGSIIHEEWVLTGAHCTFGIDAEALSIVVGTIQLRSGGDRYKIKRIINHEKYTRKALRNDIALIKIDGKIKMKKNVGAIKLGKQPVAAGSTCALTGWGKIDNRGGVPNKLQFLLFKSISNADCTKQLKGRLRSSSGQF